MIPSLPQSLCLCLLALGNLGPPARGQDTAAKSVQETELRFEQLATPAGPGSSLPNLIRGADGRHYLSWVEPVEAGVVRLRFSLFGEGQWGPARTIIEGRNFFVNWADFPSLSVLKDGTIMAHWLRSVGSGYAYNAEFALSSDGGQTWSESKLLHEDQQPVEHGFVSIAPLADSTFGAIWLDGRETFEKTPVESNMILCFRTIAADGELGAEQVIDPRVCSCCQTSLISPAPGELLVAYRDRGDEEIRDISVAHYDGKAWSTPRTVFDDNWLMPGCPVNGPALASLAGQQAALWFTGAGDGGGRVNFATRADSSRSFGLPTRLDAGSTMGRVDLVACAGGYLGSWLEHVEGNNGEWRVVRLGPQGPVGASLTLTTISTARSAGFLRMAPLGRGALVAWTSTAGEELQVVTGRL